MGASVCLCVCVYVCVCACACLCGHLVELGDDGVGGVRHDGAEHAGDVARRERHHQLLALGALVARLRHHVLHTHGDHC